MKKVMIMGLSIMVLAGACTATDSNGNEELSKTAIGTGAGAAVGALAGQLIGGDTEATLIGAGIGAAVGGGSGYYIDKKDDKTVSF